MSPIGNNISNNFKGCKNMAWKNNVIIVGRDFNGNDKDIFLFGEHIMIR